MSAQYDDKCLFCGITKGVIPGFKVYETDHSLAFLDINPVSDGHTLVIPKSHAKTLGDLSDDYLRDIGPVIKKVALMTGAEQYNILQNNGKLAFQQHVDHVHFHVVPKTSETDGLIISLENNWPQKQVSKEDLAAILEKMKSRV
ncbi:hypothetical protein SERLADRAFT_362241 [Serpula lacrymans var. lacrymans S7.9]|uniref:HIT domain-containing protein n=1 Tax=Serpula lacrymans var. lacrymans (strain S7.9) TaxID=578457 RepID=F8P0U4_SERL9|nr:uncharacterized protein SERLADRAFT_362241 [Serpula lacrymans var. lacrymans S7.9]EGO22778.1 hypothetical protein SERLADRAFT_362241 [Serpula lacrymans var. lacrymans S7.9]